MYRSNNLSVYNFSVTLTMQYQISNQPAIDPRHFSYETTRNVFTITLNSNGTTDCNNQQLHLLFTASTSNQLCSE